MRVAVAAMVAVPAFLLAGAACDGGGADRWFGADAALFDPMPKPGPNDWLARYDEPVVTFDEYRRSDPVRPTAERRTIVLQPLGTLAPAELELMKKMCRYTEIFFACPMREATAIALPTEGKREHGGHTQYLTSAIQTRLMYPRLPKDAVCCLGITVEDLYPAPSWNYVFGEALIQDRVGVYSLARYRPEFFGQTAGPDAEKTLLRRSIKVMVHETGHMFGLLHCRRYRCLMNGSNHLGELDASPVFLCPECLRKLQWNVGFDVEARYRKMLAFWKEEGFEGETAWLERRLGR